MAPVSVIESAKAGTLLAPLGTIVVSAIFIVFGCYALSGATLIRRLPLVAGEVLMEFAMSAEESVWLSQKEILTVTATMPMADARAIRFMAVPLVIIALIPIQAWPGPVNATGNHYISANRCRRS